MLADLLLDADAKQFAVLYARCLAHQGRCVAFFTREIDRQVVIEKGIRDAMGRGVMASYPVVDVQARLFDGSYHEVDSSGPAFEVAASMAFQDGAKRAGLVLLEPMMAVEVVCPES